MREELSYAQIQEIRKYVKKFNSKIDTAIKFGLSYETVLFHTKDIRIDRDMLKRNVFERTPMNITYHYSKGISGKSLDLLKELVEKGYALSKDRYGLEEYIRLKKDFPQIRRTRMYGRVVYYLDDKSKIAEKAFLEAIDKRVLSYQELKQITKVFGIE